jgi:hypothetical protein
MRINILATNENVENVRNTAAAHFEHLARRGFLTVPVSATGEYPATHWFCNFLISEEMHNKLMSLQNLSEMELGSVKMFLKNRGLKIIQ